MVLPRRELVSEIGFKMAESVQQWQREIVDVMSHIDGKHFTIDSWGNEHRSGTRSGLLSCFHQSLVNRSK
jgi:hypothetical protein